MVDRGLPQAELVKVPRMLHGDAKGGFRRATFTTRSQVLLALRVIVHAFLPGFILIGSFAVAQEELQQPDRAMPHNFVTDSQITDSLSVQTPSSSQPEIKSRQENPSASRGSFVVAPLPISSPALGTGLVPVLGYIFPFRKSDKVSPPSVVGMAGMLTDNGTRGFAAYGDLFLAEDTYRITTLYVHGNLNYDLYGLGVLAGSAGRKLPLEQSGQVFRAEVLRRVGWKFFLGMRFWSGSSDIVQTERDDRVGRRTTARPRDSHNSTGSRSAAESRNGF